MQATLNITNSIPSSGELKECTAVAMKAPSGDACSKKMNKQTRGRALREVKPNCMTPDTSARAAALDGYRGDRAELEGSSTAATSAAVAQVSAPVTRVEAGERIRLLAHSSEGCRGGTIQMLLNSSFQQPQQPWQWKTQCWSSAGQGTMLAPSTLESAGLIAA